MPRIERYVFLDVPFRASLRTALQATPIGELAANAALVAGFLRKAGLPDDADAFARTYG